MIRKRTHVQNKTEEKGGLLLLIGADIVPTLSSEATFTEGSSDRLIDARITNLVASADLFVLNLEVPLSNTATPIAKCGPNLIAPTAAAKGLSALGIGALALANNHIMDQGPEGLASTIETLDAAGIRHFGAGANLVEASRPLVLEKDGVRVGIYACAEHEFSIAGESSPGANPFDPLVSLDHVAALSEKCDFVAVLYHGGKEHYRYPSPGLRRACRRLAEKGADLVVCQHSHCVGCMEEWGGSTVVYGQGNFLFDHSDSEFWQTGLLLEVEVRKGGFSIGYVPLRKDGPRVRAAEGADAEQILDGFKERSRQILEPGFVEAEYAGFARGYLGSYVRAFAPGARSLAFRALNKLSGGRLMRALAGRVDCLAALNYLECEAHRELFTAGLRGVGNGGE